MSNQGRCWHCGQPRKEIHETLTCGSEECVTVALKRREKAQQRNADAKAKLREKNREYSQRPEVKARAREYMREYQREYTKRPEVKARRREYNQRPKVKARTREYQREYRQRKKAQEEE